PTSRSSPRNSRRTSRPSISSPSSAASESAQSPASPLSNPRRFIKLSLTSLSFRRQHMNKRLAIFACAIAVLTIGSAAAGVLVRPQPLPIRVAQSDVIFVGKVIELEPMDVDAKPFPGGTETTKYRIAVVQVNQAITGLKDEKKLRLGFVAAVKPGLPG